jgi:hypothetical protein
MSLQTLVTQQSHARKTDERLRAARSACASSRRTATGSIDGCRRRQCCRCAPSRAAGRFVCLGLVEANERDGLHCTMADVEKLDSAEETGFMPGTAASPAMPRLRTARRCWTTLRQAIAPDGDK